MQEKANIRGIYLAGDGVQASRHITSLAARIVANVVSNSGLSDHLAVTLVGSSGRGEMCFKSDIDYMILHDRALSPGDERMEKLKKELSQQCEKYGLGDLSCFGVGTDKFITSSSKFSLTDRLVLDDTYLAAGNQQIYDEFKDNVRREFAVSPREVEDTLLDMLFIYRRFRDYARFDSDEPDIKKGRGGLRDMQFLIQLAKIKYKSGGRGVMECIKDLEQHNVVTADESKKLQDGINHILTIRNELHFQFSQEKDNLDAVAVSTISKTMNTTEEEILTRYREHARNIYEIVRRVKRQIRSDIEHSQGPRWTEALKQIEDPETPREEMIAYAKSSNKFLRLGVAWNSEDPEILRNVMEGEKTAKSKGDGYYWSVLFALAHNRHTSIGVYDWLLDFNDAGNPYRKIHIEVVRNPTVTKLLKDATISPTFKEKVDRIT